MIPLTRLNNQEFYVNSDLIESVESTPDTVVTLTTGKRFIVKESPSEVLRRIVEFRRSISRCLLQEGIEESLEDGEV
ncbi:MAG TPA: flagellar FlbD family protein [Syntrophomonadaceae bacterium]|nr:flagellar FlbD family protein [Syntrophomonadaceae bacterium]